MRELETWNQVSQDRAQMLRLQFSILRARLDTGMFMTAATAVDVPRTMGLKLDLQMAAIQAGVHTGLSFK